MTSIYHDGIGDDNVSPPSSIDVLLSDRTLSGIPILVVANKQDLPSAVDVGAVSRWLKLESIPAASLRSLHLESASCVDGYGVLSSPSPCRRGAREGIEWLACELRRNARPVTVSS